MKILLVHNYYQSTSPSGEDIIFKREVELLRSRGVEVFTYEKYNNDLSTPISKIHAAFGIVYSRKIYNELSLLIKKKQPDVVHFHNIFYVISPSSYYACIDANVPIVQTLHNYRLFCVNGLLMKNGTLCEKCVGTLPWRSPIYGCYRNSKLSTIPLAIMQTIHKFYGTWTKNIDAFIALSEFSKKKLIECGLPKSKIYVKPNFFSHPPEPKYSHSGYLAFIGRLKEEKGLDVLLDASKLIQSMIIIKVIGDGPLKSRLDSRLKIENIRNVELVGMKSHSNCMEYIRNSKFLILPSVCYENFPISIIEAFACGKTVIASRLGAMAEIVQDGKTGLLFEVGNARDLAAKINWLIEHEDDCIQMGENARAEFETKYTAEKNYEMLKSIYEKIIE